MIFLDGIIKVAQKQWRLQVVQGDALIKSMSLHFGRLQRRQSKRARRIDPESAAVEICRVN
jgi:hypothetical protein